jgi:hypothetical protein
MKVAEAQVKVQTQLAEPLKLRRGLKKVMGWPHLHLPWLSNMSSGSYQSMLKEPLNIILHKLQVIHMIAVSWVGMLRQLKMYIRNLRKQLKKLGSILISAKLKL